MSINVRQKGATGELEVASDLEFIIRKVMRELCIEAPLVQIVQRNQNQSAVGGSDLSNTFGLCIEVKRQEALSVNTWWAQVCAAAARNHEPPVLLYRQNRKPWRCVLLTDLALPQRPGGGYALSQKVRSEISWEDFKEFFKQWVTSKLMAGERPRV